ncbi:MAG: NADH:ubiquinone reductase (Na(+)-transporting) subunit E, partial [Spirochaetales bacterium]|nr:NADH:ubiquinone reductase (Na(+)-transporting) subunit E [Spirochaetales bacterium]
LNWLVYHYLLIPFNLEYLRFIVFIIVIAAFVQLTEMTLERYSEPLYQSLGIFLPLITVNCAILGASLFMVIREYTFITSLLFGLGSGIGWLLAIVAMSGIRTKLRTANIPPALEGPGISLIIAGFMAMAFMGFSGMIAVS